MKGIAYSRFYQASMKYINKTLWKPTSDLEIGFDYLTIIINEIIINKII